VLNQVDVHGCTCKHCGGDYGREHHELRHALLLSRNRFGSVRF
jgi:hypothetical protein